MDLCLVNVVAFRRFREKASLQTNGKLIALIGPNEAGKSSLLRAIALLGSDDPPKSADFARGGRREDFLIEGRFFLSDEDRIISGLQSHHWLIVQKRADGDRTYQITPPAPKRDKSARGILIDLLKSTTSNAYQDGFITEDDEFQLEERIKSLSETLDEKFEDLSPEALDLTSAVSIEIRDTIQEHTPATAEEISKVLDSLMASESKLNPNEFAIRALRNRVPPIIEFDDEARNLSSEYLIQDLNSYVPTALRNLLEVAKLDISDLLTAISEDDTAQLTTMEHVANAELDGKFSTDWRQSGVKVRIRIQPDRLSVQIINEKSVFTSFSERSDGLRQFVALLAFSRGAWEGSPIMTIDEAEQRLHYDAQADLAQMLARQQVASKVIYTTHSLGCLPEDLGNGVRLAHPSKDDPTQSKILNKFWATNDPGFAPLLFGMGASTLAFLPTRSAVMVEGPVDMLILPTMLRSAMSASSLGYQLVPGLSVDDFSSIRAIGEQSRTIFLTDGDSGGRDLRDNLLKSGIPKEKITTLHIENEAEEVEDFLEKDLILDAANSLLSKYHANSNQISEEELSKKLKMSSLEKLYEQKTGEKLSKISLAYEILDILSLQPNRNILDTDYKPTLRAVAENIKKHFSAPK